MEKPLISVVVPVYNREDCISKCIESVIGLRKGSFELVVVNDGSTDSTLSKINASIAEENNQQVKVISYISNKGVNYARNRGVEAAAGTFVLFLDSDDVLTPSCLPAISEIILSRPEYKHFLFLVSDFVGSRPYQEVEYIYQDWLSGKVSGDFAHLVNRELLLTLPFDEDFRLYESLVWLQIFRKSEQQLYVPEVVMIRDRKRQDSLTNEYLLQSKHSMGQEYKYTQKFVGFFGEDMINIHLKAQLSNILRKALLLGIALNKIEENCSLLNWLDKADSSSAAKIRLINHSFFAPFLYMFIKYYSKLKQGFQR